MSIFGKASISIGTLGALGGTGYGMYSALRTRTYSELLDGTLLSTNKDEDQDKWKLRLKKLTTKAKEDTLIDSLKEIKNKKSPDFTWQDLRGWCKANIDNKNKGEQDKEFKNIQSYCTFSVKEKLTNIIEQEGNVDAVWALGYLALKKIPFEELDPKLTVTKRKPETPEVATDIKNWCNEVFENPYKGDNNQEFKNAKRVCTTNFS